MGFESFGRIESLTHGQWGLWGAEKRPRRLLMHGRVGPHIIYLVTQGLTGFSGWTVPFMPYSHSLTVENRGCSPEGWWHSSSLTAIVFGAGPPTVSDFFESRERKLAAFERRAREPPMWCRHLRVVTMSECLPRRADVLRTVVAVFSPSGSKVASKLSRGGASIDGWTMYGPSRWTCLSKVRCCPQDNYSLMLCIWHWGSYGYPVPKCFFCRRNKI